MTLHAKVMRVGLDLVGRANQDYTYVHEQLTRIYKETSLTSRIKKISLTRIQFNPLQNQVMIYLEFVWS